MSSLVDKLTKIKNKTTFFGLSVPNSTFDFTSLKITNNYPKWVDDRKDWAVFGSFTDYVIRRMINTIYPSKVKLFYNISNEHFQELRSYNIYSEFLDECEEYISLYQNMNMEWRDILPEIYVMSHCDSLVRGGFLHKPSANDKEVLECIPFFEKVEKMIKTKLDTTKEFLLNPVLGYVGLPSDADIITNDTVYEIKTTKYPERQMNVGYYQLLGYTVFYERLKKILHSKPFPLDYKIKNIGFIFPLHEAVVKMDITSWTERQKNLYMKKLLE